MLEEYQYSYFLKLAENRVAAISGEPYTISVLEKVRLGTHQAEFFALITSTVHNFILHFTRWGLMREGVVDYDIWPSRSNVAI